MTLKNSTKDLTKLLRRLYNSCHQHLDMLNHYPKTEIKLVILSLYKDLLRLCRKCLMTLEKDNDDLIDIPILSRSMLERTVEIMLLCNDGDYLPFYKRAAVHELRRHLIYGKDNAYFKEWGLNPSEDIEKCDKNLKDLPQNPDYPEDIKGKLKTLKYPDIYIIYQHYCNISHANFRFIGALSNKTSYDLSTLDYIKQIGCWAIYSREALNKIFDEYDKNNFENAKKIFKEIENLCQTNFLNIRRK